MPLLTALFTLVEGFLESIRNPIVGWGGHTQCCVTSQQRLQVQVLRGRTKYAYRIDITLRATHRCSIFCNGRVCNGMFCKQLGCRHILQLGNAFFSLASPASVTLVQMRSSLFRLASPLRCINPASLIWVPSSDSYSKLFCVLWYTSPVIATVTAKSGSRQRATKRE